MRGVTVCSVILTLALSGCGRGPEPTPEPEPSSIGGPLYAPRRMQPSPAAMPADAVQPIVISDGRLSVIEKEDVPAQYNGVILAIGTEIKPDETPPVDQIVTVKVGTAERRYRRLKEGDIVAPGQLLGQIDDTLPRNNVLAKKTRLSAARAELPACEKALEEAEKRYQTQIRLASAAAEEETRLARVNWEKGRAECLMKKEAFNQACLELEEAHTHLQMHEVRSRIGGVVKAILKQPGESVRTGEPVFQVQNLARLRVEGMVDVQYLPRLRQGMKVVVEPTRADSPVLVLKGHLQEITGVAVTADGRTLVSSSEDGTARVWMLSTGVERRVLQHGDAVRAVACSPAGHLCLTGGADGSARLWNLADPGNDPVCELKGEHGGAITCVAFTPDGKHCATGGEDRLICIWDTATGTLQYRLPDGHHGGITSIEFTPQARLVSAGRDNTLRIWQLGQQGASLLSTWDRREGDVRNPGTSPDGRRVLFDVNRELRIRSIPDGSIEAVLQNQRESTGFATFAAYSPDARLLVSGTADGGMQLWRAPCQSRRGHEWCRLVAPERAPATCAAFVPGGNYLATGTRAGQVLVWAMPAAEEVERSFIAQVTWIERSVESNTGQVRIWAEIDNPEQRLLPGTAATMTIYPELP